MATARRVGGRPPTERRLASFLGCDPRPPHLAFMPCQYPHGIVAPDVAVQEADDVGLAWTGALRAGRNVPMSATWPHVND